MTGSKGIRLLVITVLFLSNLNGQNTLEKVEGLSWFDKTIGVENTPIFDGLGYVEQYKSINEKHKFFDSQDFLNGSVVYDGQLYYGIKLKYDLFVDEVVINLEDGFEAVMLQPEKNRISSFSIDGNMFENISAIDTSSKEITGFFEILFTSPAIKLLKKHRKKRIQKIGKIIYYEFFDDNFNVLFNDGTYQIVENNRDFIRLFPEFKKEIKKYKIQKSDKDNSMRILLQRLDLLMSNRNKK